MPSTDSRLQFGICQIEWDDLLDWQKLGGAKGALAAKILACLQSEAATSEWVDQAMDLRQELHASVDYSGWCTTLLLRALDRDNDVNPCGCPDWGRYCYYGRHSLRHDDCAFQDCSHRQYREDILTDAARRRFYGFDTATYSSLRKQHPAMYSRLYFSEGYNQAGVQAVVRALLHHQRYQSCRRPHRDRGLRLVSELIAAAAKFSGPRTFVNGQVDQSSTPVEDYLFDRATEVLQRSYPLARDDRRGRAARRERLVSRWLKLAGERHVNHPRQSSKSDGLFSFSGGMDFWEEDIERSYPAKPQCHWHSHRFAEPPSSYRETTGIYRSQRSDRLDAFFTYRPVLQDLGTGKPFNFLDGVSLDERLTLDDLDKPFAP